MEEKKQLNNKGFSLMELLVCLAISAFVILAAYSLVMVGTKSYNTNSKTTSLQQEVSYTNNLIREVIMKGKQLGTYIWTSNDGKTIELYTNKGQSDGMIICYDKAVGTVYIYNDGSSAWTHQYYRTDTNKEEHIITKYATDFKVEFLDTEEGPTAILAGVSDGDGTGIEGCTDLIRVTITFDYKGKTDTSEVIYQIRNKS